MGELTNIVAKNVRSYCDLQGDRYVTKPVAPEKAEFWLTSSSPKKFKQILDGEYYYKADLVMINAMPSIAVTTRRRLSEIRKLQETIRSGELEQIEDAVRQLQLEKEIVSKIITNLKELFGRSLLVKIVDGLMGGIPKGARKEIAIFEELEKEVSRTLRGR